MGALMKPAQDSSIRDAGDSLTDTEAFRRLIDREIVLMQRAMACIEARRQARRTHVDEEDETHAEP